MFVKSYKLKVEDFECIYGGVPMNYKFFDNFMNNYLLHCYTIEIFLESQYCTVTHVKKYFDHYKNLHGVTFASGLMRYVFTHEKFACLKNKYIKIV